MPNSCRATKVAPVLAIHKAKADPISWQFVPASLRVEKYHTPSDSEQYYFTQLQENSISIQFSGFQVNSNPFSTLFAEFLRLEKLAECRFSRCFHRQFPHWHSNRKNETSTTESESHAILRQIVRILMSMTTTDRGGL